MPKMILTKTNYVDLAEKTIKDLSNRTDRKGRKIPLLSTSKIRKILSMSADIYNDAKRIAGDTIDDDMKSRIQYLRMHVAYEAGRDRAVKDFIEAAKLLDIIQEIGCSKEQLILFCHYMEALVAYQRYFGGRDN